MFTKKHYQQVALLLKNTKPTKRNQHDNTYYNRNAVWMLIVIEFEKMFAFDNSEFNKQTFEDWIYHNNSKD